jgi:CubicO group peptidase (beta-lactamase class C family)
MRKTILLLLVACNGNLLAQQSKTNKIDSLLTSLYSSGQFTGAVLVAQNDRLVYKKAFGLADRAKGIPFTIQTKEYLGSISKQFTAMGIMILKDRQKLTYDQSVRDFFPELPTFMQPVTVRQLLYHTSGLAIFDDYPNMTEKDVFNILRKQDKLRFTPGEKFEYCNAGYSLLGMIIEKVSGQSLNAFMTRNIFQPLGMDHSEVNESTHPDTTRAIGYNLYGAVNSYDSYMGGNASVISTVEDLYKWDRALYHPAIVRSETLAEAFTPSNQVANNPALLIKDDLFGDKSYGFGIWISQHNGTGDFFHDGAFSGYMIYNERMTSSHIAIIELSNLRQRYAYDIRRAILDILDNKPYDLPKMDASVWLHKKISTIGIDSAISGYRLLHLSDTARYDFSENVLNSYAYILLRANRINDAIKLFLLNTEFYPNSANVFDSLGDGYEKAGDKTRELQSRIRCVQLDPNNEYEKNRIKALQSPTP